MSDDAAKPEVGFDHTLSALKQIVERLESGSLSLEAALQAFEEGIRLARRGTQILDAAEHRVEVLTAAPAPGASGAAAQGAAAEGAAKLDTKIDTFTPTT